VFPKGKKVAQWVSVARIEEEQRSMDATRKLVQIYEQKIKEKIDEVWEE